jgi:hypothetical protein
MGGVGWYGQGDVPRAAYALTARLQAGDAATRGRSYLETLHGASRSGSS